MENGGRKSGLAMEMEQLHEDKFIETTVSLPGRDNSCGEGGREEMTICAKSLPIKAQTASEPGLGCGDERIIEWQHCTPFYFILPALVGRFLDGARAGARAPVRFPPCLADWETGFIGHVHSW